MVRHHAIGQDPQAVEPLVGAHEFDELVLLLVAENEPAVHHAGDAVVIGDGEGSGGFEAGPAHGRTMRRGGEEEDSASHCFIKGQAF